jgi:hypothetical protein
MLSRTMIVEIERLAASGYSHRRIAIVVGVSRGSVANVLAGRHRKARHAGCVAVPEIDPTGERKRCDTCGASVYPPCLACWVRGLVASRRVGTERG